MSSVEQQLQIAVANYLRNLQATLPDEADREGLGVAVQCLQDALKLPDLDGPEAKALPALLSVWSSSPLLSNSAAGASNNASGTPSFDKFISMLKEKGFFAGVTEGSREYEERLATAKARFEAKYGVGSASGCGSTAATGASNAPISEERKKQAEELKLQGNQLLGQGKHAEAVEKYTQAINLNPNEHIYYANRAAALLNLHRYDDAIKDCQEAIRLDPTYGKAHYRLGQAYYHLSKYDDALKAYQEAKKYSKDASMTSSVEAAIEQCKTAKSRGSSGFPFGGGMGGAPGSGIPDLSAALGGLDLNAILSNPAMQQMMASMAQQFMAGAGGAGGAGSNPLANFLNNPAVAALRNDPDLGPVIDDIETNGPQAAFKYLNNPAVMQKLGSLISPLLGGLGGAR